MANSEEFSKIKRRAPPKRGSSNLAEHMPKVSTRKIRKSSRVTKKEVEIPTAIAAESPLPNLTNKSKSQQTPQQGAIPATTCLSSSGNPKAAVTPGPQSSRVNFFLHSLETVGDSRGLPTNEASNNFVLPGKHAIANSVSQQAQGHCQGTGPFPVDTLGKSKAACNNESFTKGRSCEPKSVAATHSGVVSHAKVHSQHSKDVSKKSPRFPQYLVDKIGVIKGTDSRNDANKDGEVESERVTKEYLAISTVSEVKAFSPIQQEQSVNVVSASKANHAHTFLEYPAALPQSNTPNRSPFSSHFICPFSDSDIFERLSSGSIRELMVQGIYSPPGGYEYLSESPKGKESNQEREVPCYRLPEGLRKSVQEFACLFDDIKNGHCETARSTKELLCAEAISLLSNSPLQKEPVPIKMKISDGRSASISPINSTAGNAGYFSETGQPISGGNSNTHRRFSLSSPIETPTVCERAKLLYQKNPSSQHQFIPLIGCPNNDLSNTAPPTMDLNHHINERIPMDLNNRVNKISLGPLPSHDKFFSPHCIPSPPKPTTSTSAQKQVSTPPLRKTTFPFSQCLNEITKSKSATVSRIGSGTRDGKQYDNDMENGGICSV